MMRAIQDAILIRAVAMEDFCCEVGYYPDENVRHLSTFFDILRTFRINRSAGLGIATFLSIRVICFMRNPMSCILRVYHLSCTTKLQQPSLQ